MKHIPFKFVSLAITTFVPQSGECSLRLIVNDGADKQVLKTCTLEQAEELATTLLHEARDKLKKHHEEKSLETDPLAGVLVLQLKQDEELVLEKTTRFLAQVRERVRAGKSKRISWGDVEKQITGLTIRYE